MGSAPGKRGISGESSWVRSTAREKALPGTAAWARAAPARAVRLEVKKLLRERERATVSITRGAHITDLLCGLTYHLPHKVASLAPGVEQDTQDPTALQTVLRQGLPVLGLSLVRLRRRPSSRPGRPRGP